MDETHAITRLLESARLGEEQAQERLWEAVYAELRCIAASQIAKEQSGRTLQPTALVNEVYLRLFGNGPAVFENRRHFFAAAARAMHQIRVDDARSRKRIKRGGGGRIRKRESPDGPAVFDPDRVDILALDEALTRLASQRPELVELVRLRFFVGMSMDETAEVLGISRRTVAYRWRLARAWLFGALAAGEAQAEAMNSEDGDGPLGSD